MDKKLHRPDLGLLILRLGLGAMMLTHGWPKVQKILAGDWTFANPIGVGEAPSLLLAALAEFGCSLLVLAGFRVRLAVLPILFTMLVAAIIVHANDPWAKKELPLLYASGYATLLLLGGGRYSVDGRKSIHAG
ncbi:MAG: DoxX family protein [Bryobacteraceae bacterium]|nr:DoxX family protein [Bryobacteraceae bacterium]